MQTMQNGYRGLGLLVDLNIDRGFFAATIVLGLSAGGWMGTLIG